MHRRLVTALAASLAAILGCGTGLVPLDRGAPLEVRLMPGEEVVLDGAGSFDPEGEELGYAWRQVSGPKVELREADTPWPRFVPSGPGRYEFELVVTAPPVGNKPPAVPSSTTERIPGEPARLVVNVLPPNRPPVIFKRPNCKSSTRRNLFIGSVKWPIHTTKVLNVADMFR